MSLYKPEFDTYREFLRYHEARREHVWRLRQEGLTLRVIGDRIGLSCERVRQMLVKHARRMAA